MHGLEHSVRTRPVHPAELVHERTRPLTGSLARHTKRPDPHPPRPSAVSHPLEDVDGLPATEEEMARINALPQKPYHVTSDEPPAYVTTPMDYSTQS